MGWDERGKIHFMYDYERADDTGKKQRIRGLISQNHQYSGTQKLILHAYTGMKYFWEHRNNSDICFDFFDGIDDFVALENKFAGPFDDRIGTLWGLNALVLRGDCCEEEEQESQEEEIWDESAWEADPIYGTIHISYTGNPGDGYELKYYYDHTEEGDIKTALEQHTSEDDVLDESYRPEDKDWKEYIRIIRGRLEEASTFFRDNAVLCKQDDVSNYFDECHKLFIELNGEIRRRSQLNCFSYYKGHPDFYDMLRYGRIKVFSMERIKKGSLVSPDRLEIEARLEQYVIYEAEINAFDVDWTDGDGITGIFASDRSPVSNEISCENSFRYAFRNVEDGKIPGFKPE